MNRGINGVGASLLALMAMTGSVAAQEEPQGQPVPQQQVQEAPQGQVSPSPSPGSSPQPLQSPAVGSPQPGSSPTPQAVRTPAQPQLTADQVSEEQVEQLVTALSQIEPLLRQASTDLRASQDPAQRQQIERRFESQATEIVEEVGLTVDLYVQLVTLAKQDQEFGETVTEQLRQLQAESAAPTPSPQSSPDPDQPADPTPTPAAPSDATDPLEAELEGGTP